MAIRFYDEALVNKIQKWIRDPNLRILKPNEVSRLFQMRADQTNDKPLTLPLIAISRDSSINVSVASKRNLTFDGYGIGETEDKSILFNAIPIEINYQIDIYTKRYDEGDEYLRNFIFNIANYPQMEVELPYNNVRDPDTDIRLQHVCYLRLENTVTDNSDVSEKLFPDEFTRWTLRVRVDDAYLFSVPLKDNAHIIGAEVVSHDSQANVNEYQGAVDFTKKS